MQNDGTEMVFQEYTQYQPAINERKMEEQHPALADRDERAGVLIRVEPIALGNSPGPFSDALKMIRAQNARPDLSLRALAENAEGILSLELVPDIGKWMCISWTS
ncbi:Hypothetical predicted protein [Olea europaea subsp. europaea]|uniref:Uncharacterized protein n=1 Tax=Olea europaea subsp. europaea TaxID=158383 RepID=A0A8S0UFG9_OLEEU|nr:Hypothetical predicted protein [Olea europaea subsp. europaea]